MIRGVSVCARGVLGGALVLAAMTTLGYYLFWPLGSDAALARNGDAPGGDIPPVRYVLDPYPTLAGIAVDSKNNVVVMSDTNRKSLLIYDRASGDRSAAATEPLRFILGPEHKTQVGFVSGVALDPVSREVYMVNNDIEDNMVVFSYDAEGNAEPSRILRVPHGAWDVSLNRSRNEVAISIQNSDAVVIYRLQAEGLEAPVRYIRGPNTGLTDPHGIYFDAVDNEIVVANHGNTRDEPLVRWVAGRSVQGASGHFRAPSITVFSAMASGDAEPLRTIQGPGTQLDWPMGLDVDTEHNEIVVANNGGNSVLIFGRTDDGDVAPMRVIRGDLTGIVRPVGVAVDTKNDELWVANFGDHSAVVFDRTADGNVVPKRSIRNAPAGTPTCGFGNPMAVAYDSKRDEILVPN